MQTQPFFPSFGGSYIGDEFAYDDESTYLNDYFQKMPIPLSQDHHMGYSTQYQAHGVQIAHQEDGNPSMRCEGGVGGLWGIGNIGVGAEQVRKQYNSEVYLDNFSDSSAPQFCRPMLSLATSLNDSYLTQNQLCPGSSLPSAHPDMGTYSNDSSPFMNQYTLPSVPRTPVTPAATPLINGQIFTAPGVPGAFVLVPVMAQDPAGNITTVFLPKQTMLDSYIEEQCAMGLQGGGYTQDNGFNMESQYTGQQPFDYMESQPEEVEDDGPELVGMGLYDEPPELLYSTATTPELARLMPPGINGDGRGLVLEQSFGLPEDEGDEEEEDDDDIYEEEIEIDEQDIRY